MPVSSEFVALCQTQIVLLTRALEASISVVYLTEDLVGGTQSRLIPIAAYPETLVEYEKQPNSFLLPATLTHQEPIFDQLIDRSIGNTLKGSADDRFIKSSSNEPSSPTADEGSLNQGSALVDQRQIVVPLIYEEVVFGFLVTRRAQCGWEAWEQSQVEEIAKTLAIACVLDQRYHWSQREREHERIIYLQQHDLVDNLLHQFRNSLTALHTFGKLVLKRLIPGDRSHDLAANITRETERLRELAQQMEVAINVGNGQSPRSLPAASVNLPDEAEKLGDAMLDTRPVNTPSVPMLTTAGLLPGATSLPLERCLVETILEPLLSAAREIAQEKGLALHTHLSEDLPPVWANSQALREVFTNLMENAIKYTPPGGQIWVLAETLDESSFLEISISDTGLGIPSEDLPHLFERHYRGVKAQSDIPGSGLGLAIVQSLIEQMHGKIQVFSPALPHKLDSPEATSQPISAVGSTFLVYLPLAIKEFLHQ